eukprot:Opistho-2@2607
MEVLGQLQVRSLTFLSVGIAMTTIFTCYGFAVGLGHVPAWLPMISDCAVQAPERYPFRFGIISGAVLMIINVVIMYTYLATLRLQATSFGPKYDMTSMILGTVASLGLATVGAVNEEELLPVHDGAAVTFFGLYQVYMILVTLKLQRCSANVFGSRLSPDRAALSLKIKTVAACVSLGALLTLLVLGLNFDENRTGIAVMEWLSTLCVQFFNLSYCIEFTDDFTLSTIFYPATSSIEAGPVTVWRQMDLAAPIFRAEKSQA